MTEALARRVQDVSPAELQPLLALVDARYPDIYAEMATSLFIYMLDIDPMPGQTPEQKARLAFDMATHVGRDIGGVHRYIPLATNWEKDKVARAIITAHKAGQTTIAIARKYRITERRVYQVLQAWTEEKRRAFMEQQATLPLK